MAHLEVSSEFLSAAQCQMKRYCNISNIFQYESIYIKVLCTIKTNLINLITFKDVMHVIQMMK